MNRLDSDLKRLMTWSRRAPASPPEPEEPPYGFATRVVASWHPAEPGSLLLQLRQIAWTSGCVALGIILCGIILLIGQEHAPEPATGISSALSFAATSLTP
jgi:hypothetical protein